MHFHALGQSFSSLLMLTLLMGEFVGGISFDLASVKPNSVSKYLIQLKKPLTMEKLCTADDKAVIYGNANDKSGGKKVERKHLRESIIQTFSFGQFEGFTGVLDRDQLLRVANNPLVADITPDVVVRAVDVKVQENAPLHLVRLSRKSHVPATLESGDFFYDDEYQGEGVTVYIVDTGVFVEHPEFEGRANKGPNFSSDVKNEDFVGHGTHVAGIVGSETYGVAKGVRLVSIKVLDRYGQGTLSSVIAGLEYAVNHREENGNKPGVINLSLGAPKSEILNHALDAAAESGMFVVAAGGNANVDACYTSPASSKHAFTVGAIDAKQDKIAAFSNWGKCINMFASGVDVESVSIDKNDFSDVQVLSGTSMASPAIAGLSAILLSKDVKVEDLKSELNEMAVHGIITKRNIMMKPGTPNIIASNGLRGDDYLGTGFINPSKTPQLWSNYTINSNTSLIRGRNN